MQTPAFESPKLTMPDARPMPSNNAISTAILLAAGRGSRLSPHTDHTPKPLLAYAGKPTLQHIIESLESTSITRLIIVTNHLEHKITQFLDALNIGDATSVKTVSQQQLRGTADAVLTAIDAVPEWFDGSFLVSATDYIVESNFYTDLLDFHTKHDCGISISLKKIPTELQSARSSVRISDEMRVSEVVEKPAPGTEPSPFTANLVYLLPPTIVDYLRETKPSQRGEKELQSAINQWLNEQGCAKGLLQPTPQEWHAGLQ